MSIIKFKINTQSFNQILRDEMSQKLTYSGKEYKFFEYVLSTKVGHVVSYKDWEEIDGFYYSEVKFAKSMILDKIKNLTTLNEIFRDCLVDVYMTTRDKYGYYQIQSGMTKVGFSIKDQVSFYEKLVSDSANLEKVSDGFNISMSETIRTDSNRIFGDSKLLARKVYSLFVNDTDYEGSLFNDAMSMLKEVFSKQTKEDSMQTI
jgi:hypothetical protein